MSFEHEEPSRPSADPEVESIFDVTPLQESMLFAKVLSGAPGTYLLQTALELVGPLDRERLREALASVIARHPSLRTSFVWEELDQPQQVVWSTADVPWEVVDWSGQPRYELKRRWSQLLEEDRRAGMDLELAPLLRATLVRLDRDEHLLLLTTHHIVIDGWSLVVLMREVFASYGGQAPAHRPFELRDYVRWLRRRPSEAALWAAELGGVSPSALRLPPPGDPSGGPAEQSAVLDQATASALEGAARARGLRMATLYEAAWAIVLRLYTQRSDVTFGVVVAGRPPAHPRGRGSYGGENGTLLRRIWKKFINKDF